MTYTITITPSFIIPSENTHVSPQHHSRRGGRARTNYSATCNSHDKHNQLY
ncbi:hypothetical protein Smp_183790 [Schistosoma mansoni]|uniref:hypothetical protein n=1 Tax=Schistosoma mansoni TaxID=6183 RepID=UPI00019B3571|nr:hypothetical protein Smp_183790 [Schistosoma mansoni]|eukprot:XP_018652115.1 hypothetical protein Smp_183790 [Schistosoma mansoni]